MNALRLVVWSVFHSSDDLGSCSAVNSCVDLCEALYKETEGRFHVYFVGPPIRSNMYLPERLTKMDWCSVVHLGPEKVWKFRPFPSNELLNFIHPDSSHLAYDMILTRDTLQSFNFNFGLIKRAGAWFLPVDVPVAAMLNEALDDKNVIHQVEKAGIVATLASAMTCKILYVNSEHERSLLLALARKHLSSAEVVEVDKKCVIIPHSVRLNHIRKRVSAYNEARRKRIAETGQLTVFHAGTYQSKRNLSKICAGLDALHPSLHKRFRFLNSSQQDGIVTCRHIDVEMRNGQSREQYHNNLAEGDILICMTESETTGFAYNEAIASGMLPIVIDAPWIRERMPPGHPWIVSDIEKQLPVALKWVSENWSKVPKQIDACMEHLKGFDLDFLAPKWMKSLQMIAQDFHTESWKNLSTVMGVKYFQQALDKTPSNLLGYDDLIKTAQVCAEVDGVSLRSLTPFAMRLVLMANGYEDAGGRVPFFQRV